MNGDLGILKMDAAVFSVKTEKAAKIETVEVREVEISESRTLKIRSRFERLKKNLRRRSHNIL